jgi:hypothetical protein
MSPVAIDTIFAAPGIATAFDALVRSYEYLVIDAGAAPDLPLDTLALVTPHAMLIADAASNPVTIAAHEGLRAAGFSDVTLVIASPGGEMPRAAAA